MLNSKFYKSVLFLVVLLIAILPNYINATHIIGGDITYKSLGGDKYEITLTLRRDCQLGQVGFDPYASIGIYGQGRDKYEFVTEVRIPFMVSDTVGNTIVSNCGFEGSNVCVQRTTYRTTITLPFRTGGYIIAYQRCCRNGSLNNITFPLETGTTEWIEISETALLTKNSSPTFNNWPDVYICANKPLVFDHSGTDIDGDSIVYKLCTPYNGADIINNTPQPPFLPPYSFIQWQDPYNQDNMMGGVPLTIDPNTGVLTAIPNLVGQFLIGVCMEEYRNGMLISTVRRDFQYNVRICSEPVVANFEVAVDACDSLSFNFINKSIGATEYQWNFNYPSSDITFMSSEENPTFRYGAPGLYNVRLVAKSTNGACDSIFNMQVVATVGADIPDLNLVANEFVICAGEKIALLNNPNPINTYQWSPQQGLDLSDPSNPIFIGVESGIYSVTVTNDSKCSNVGTIVITVKPSTFPIVITGDKNICGNSVQLVASGGSGIFEWSTNSNFDVIISNNDTLNTTQSENSVTYFVRSVQADCGEVVENITVKRSIVSVDYVQNTSLCKNGSKTISLNNLNSDQILSYSWNDPHIVSFIDNTITINALASDSTNFVINGLVTNQFGCSQEISLIFNILSTDPISIDAKLQSCDDLTMCFEIIGNFQGNVLWMFGSSQANDTSTNLKPCFLYPKSGNYSITLTNTEVECPFETVHTDINVPAIGDRKVEILSQLVDCNSSEVCFRIEGNYLGGILWDFGFNGNDQDTSSLANPCYTYSGEGIYNVTLTNINPVCPFETASINVKIEPRFSINPISDIVICEGEKVSLAATSNDTTATYLWYNKFGELLSQGSNYELNPMEDTELYVKAFNSLGCRDSISVKISIFKFTYTIDLPQNICPDEDFQIRVNIENPENYTFVWSPAECIVMGGNTHQPILTAIPNKSITVVITNKITGCNETRNITLMVEDPLVYNFSGELCNNQPSTVSLNINNPENYTYQWSPPALIISGGNTPNPVVKVGLGQVLTVLVTHKATGCITELTYTPIVLPPISVVFTETNIEIKQGKSVDLVIKNSISGAIYSWSNGEKGTSITVNPLETTTYTVTVVDANGCTGIGQITVNVRTVNCTDKDEYLPNAFTPNGDGKNDILYVKSNVITDMMLVIYNRWGQEMFSTNNINDGWDGSFQGKLLSPDVYAYYLKATCLNGDQFVKKGNVSLLK